MFRSVSKKLRIIKLFKAGLNTMSSTSRVKVEKPECLEKPLNIPSKLLMGPGPSNASSAVLRAMGNPLLGHLHQEFIQIMDEVKEGLSYLFQTNSRYIFCVSGTGHAGMEAVFTNLLETDDVVLIAKNGIWGERAADMVKRQGGNVRVIEKPPGEAFNLEEIENGIRQHNPTLVFIVHVESSTGVLQPLEDMGNLCHRYGALFAVDTVASAGGTPFFMDSWEIDVTYTGSQKVLSCPPSLSPVALSDRALNRIRNRRKAPRSFYFDFTWLLNYWGCDGEPRRYHHTGPITSIYALRESLSEFCKEGLENSWMRHASNAARLQEGLTKLGLELYVQDPGTRAPTVTAVSVPKDIQWKEVCDFLMERYQVEISGGLGPTVGKIWRIGLLGENAKKENVDLILNLLQTALNVARHNKL